MLTYNGNVLKVNNNWLERTGPIDPNNPLNLPPFTVRFLFEDENYDPNVLEFYNPYTDEPIVGVSLHRHSYTPNVWDITYNNTDWTSLFWNKWSYGEWYYDPDYQNWNNYFTPAFGVRILGANTTGVLNMDTAFNNNAQIVSIDNKFDLSTCLSMNYTFVQSSVEYLPEFDLSNVTSLERCFAQSWNLKEIPNYDLSSATNLVGLFYGNYKVTNAPNLITSNCTDFNQMFLECHSLTNVPLLDTSKATNVDLMFGACVSVESGALDLYNQMSSQNTPPSSHNYTFMRCGSDTINGLDELNQIPQNWGGNLVI